jgi:hypothetical protein
MWYGIENIIPYWFSWYRVRILSQLLILVDVNI